MRTVEKAVFLLLSPAVANVTNQNAIHSNIMSGAAACYFPEKKGQLAIRIVRRLAESYCRTFFIAGAEKWILN
jgi:4-diphosphocytidyl-2C-methyl-D-erythritol kinase